VFEEVRISALKPVILIEVFVAFLGLSRHFHVSDVK
jgi:hypothetical protein